MFNKKKCRYCEYPVKDEWNYCPECGESLKEKQFEEDIIKNIDKELENLDKMFGFSFDIPKIRIKPMGKASGINIIIQRGPGSEPKIKVKTFGDYKKIEPDIKKKLGVDPSVEEVEERVKKISKVKVTEEPETEIKSSKEGQIVKIKLPDVKSEEDVEVKQLDQSIEVKAFAGDKAYFTLIPVQPGSSINKKFEDGMLTIEIKKCFSCQR